MAHGHPGRPPLNDGKVAFAVRIRVHEATRRKLLDQAHTTRTSMGVIVGDLVERYFAEQSDQHDQEATSGKQRSRIQEP